MKRFSTIALLLLLLVASLFVVTSCKDDETVVDVPDSGSISIAEDGMPQLMYVLGEELDLSNGILTLDLGEEKKEIPLNSDGVSVSGYDKNKLGEQTVTVTYGEHTTQFTVTVVERMQAIEFVTDYLVGDVLDITKGRLKITRNDGTNYTVVLGNDKVTLSGFDSNTVAKQTVTAKYDSGDGVYECKFDVTVHAIETIELNKPTKVNYKSHENGVDLTGASITLKGKGGELVRQIAVTDDMVSGYDFSAVNKDNSPNEQTVNVAYDNKNYPFNITITYTDISFFKEKAASFESFDWTGEEIPEISEEAGELALELMEKYLDFSTADKEYITSEESLWVARVALYYGIEVMDDDFNAMENAFVISGGELYLMCESPKAVEDAIDALQNYDSDIYRVTPILTALIDEFSSVQFVEGVTFGDFGVLAVENYEIIIDIFDYMLELHEKFEAIGADWKTVGVNTYEAQIKDAYAFVVGSEYRGTYVEVFYYTSAWSGEKEVFDSLYTYYYENNDIESLKALSSAKLPAELNAIANYIVDALDQITSIANYAQIDTSVFFFDYYMAQKTADEVKNGENEMVKALYSVLPVNEIFGLDGSTDFYFDTMIDYLRTMEGGFQSFSGGLLGIEEYHALMAKYMDIAFKLSTDDENFTYQNSAEYGNDIQAMFKMYVDLTPTQQFNFLSTLNAFYGVGFPPLAFDDSGEWAEMACFFVTILNDYYRSNLSDEGDHVYNELVIAMEIFAQRYAIENWLEEFTSAMDGIAESYEALSDEEKAYLSYAYDKYTDIRGRFTEPDVLPELGEWEDDFAALDEALLCLQVSYYLIEEGGMTPYGMYFSAYERAQQIVDYILENAPQDIIDAYYYESLYVFEDITSDGTGEDGTEIGDGETTETAEEPISYDYMINMYRTVYISYLISFSDAGNVYDLYVGGDLAEFYKNSFYITWADVLGGEETTFNKEIAMTAINMFRELSLEEKILFTLMEGQEGYYYVALKAFLEASFTEKAADAAEKLISLEQWVVVYESTPDETNLASLKTALNELKAASVLDGEDETSFEPFKEMYEYYVALCEEIIADAENNTQVEA